MKISIETDSYNERRYGKPWIARVNFAESSQGNFEWGEYIGEIGGPGLVEIDAEPGDVIARGQKDHRKPRNSAPDYFVLQEDGTLQPLIGKAEALKHARARGEAK